MLTAEAERARKAGAKPAPKKPAPKPTSQTNVQKAAATKKPVSRKGFTVATKEGTIIAEQRHVEM
jgi:hypothetical protein